MIRITQYRNHHRGPPSFRGRRALPDKGHVHGYPAFRQAPTTAGNMAYGKMAVLYSLLLIYGSLFPFRDWDWHAHALHILLSPPWPPALSRSDVITNIAVYL